MTNKDNTPIITEQSFTKSKEEVWKAITDPIEMRQWFFAEMPDHKAEVGFKTQFNVDAGEREFMHLWKITEVIPFEKLVCQWEYEGYDGIAMVSYELFEETEGCKIRVTASGIDTFSDDVPEFRRESCEGGWKYFINQRLKEYLEE
ncbi:SRPBCC family protein [Marinifilum flexuosum]|uniref:SRPBCC family protein n=1 Tax=Marinifilum flexuosum TaxID=1117708 RepID=UPI0024940FBF|nr:SRPBCC domain-containing protein [Marinifilum flexuosum]